jgi:hypothetical protein
LDLRGQAGGILERMCNYTQVGYCCGHCRYTVRAWCIEYERTHKRCPLHVVAVEKRCVEFSLVGALGSFILFVLRMIILLLESPECQIEV